MRVATVALPAEGSLELDVCKRCHLVWFDRDELARFPRRADGAEPESPPRLVSTADLVVTTERLAERTSRAPGFDSADVVWFVAEVALEAILDVLD